MWLMCRKTWLSPSEPLAASAWDCHEVVPHLDWKNQETSVAIALTGEGQSGRAYAWMRSAHYSFPAKIRPFSSNILC